MIFVATVSDYMYPTLTVVTVLVIELLCTRVPNGIFTMADCHGKCH